MSKHAHPFTLSKEVRTLLHDEEAVFRLLSEGKKIQDIIRVPNHVLENYAKLAEMIYKEERYDDAKAAFFFLINVMPENQLFWKGLAQSCLKLREYSAAQRACEELMLLDPHNIENIELYTTLLIEMQKYEEAEEFLVCLMTQQNDLSSQLKTLHTKVLCAFHDDEVSACGS